MKNIIKKIIFFSLIITCFTKTSAFDISTLWPINSSVIDKAWILNQEEKENIETKIQEIRDKYTTEILLVIISSTEGEEISSVWTEIWQKIWVWKADKDNWVVILIAIDDRAWNISTWYWVEWVLPDLLANRIWEKNFVLFKKERYYDWIAWTLNDFEKAFEWDSSIISLQKEWPSWSDLADVFWIIEMVFATIISALLFKPIIKDKKYKKFFLYLLIAYLITLPITYFFIKEFFGTIILNTFIWFIWTIIWIAWKIWKWKYNNTWWWWKWWGWGWFWWFGWWSFGWWWSSGKW